jgi:starch synthase
MGNSLKVWFLSPEVAPFAKTGGLADMAGSLPGTLRKLGVDVRVGLPCYRTVKEGKFSIRKVMKGLEVPSDGTGLPADVLRTETDEGVPVYFFDRGDLFDRADLYGTPDGDFPDNLKRFAYFCRAALVFAKKARFRFDVVHCHDWQTGLIPAYLKSLYHQDPFFSSAASVFTVHNMGYQGLFPAEELSACGLPLSEFHPGGIEYWGNISLLKAGIVYADAITTVSPKYSQEIQTPEFGMGMDDILRRKTDDLYGILNGVDYEAWDPAKDPHIKANYGLRDTRGKRTCKEALVHEMGLDQRFLQRPVLAVVSRLTAQKGYDLLLQIVDDVVGLDAALVILAAGEQKYQQALSELGKRFRESVAVKIGFDEPLAHRIMAGADIFLAPARYEPCGLTQIYALKYGTVPVVRATGGLDDTIQQFDSRSGEGTGFKFLDYEVKGFLAQIKEALKTYDDRLAWEQAMNNGMRRDFSWEESARKYVVLYQKMRERLDGNAHDAGGTDSPNSSKGRVT